MKSYLQNFLIGAFGLVLVMLFLPACAPLTTVTTTSQIYWGIYLDGVPWDMNKLKRFESSINKSVSIVHWGQPWWHCYSRCGYQSFNAQRAQYEAVRQHGAIPLLDWGAWDYAVDPVTDQPQFSLKSILAGTHDAFLTEWATQARDWGHPFFLRLNWEMNGNWYPWSESKNGNAPGEYVQAWRHVHDIFKRVGANNVTWVWCVSIEYPGSQDIRSLYPGDDYVDWVGMDGFNWVHIRGLPWRSMAALFTPTYNFLTSLAPNKPIIIAEFASSENLTTTDPELGKARWISDAFLETLPKQFRNVKAIAWFNWNEGKDAYDWEWDSSISAANAFKQGIASEYYASNSFANLPNAKIQPLDSQYKQALSTQKE
ncbi:MAG TPA: glycosyl hydrolase [Anaerolineae bacterium]|nr:glycosyl hydrolase [Anaerolineae bacterium]